MNWIIANALYNSHDPFGAWAATSIASPKQLKPNHILLLHGGEDISPSIYNEFPNKYCHASKTPSKRDAFELACIERARKIGIPIIGICRGAQLLCCVDGGSLLQHLTKHSKYGHHTIQDSETGEYYRANSAHHQMMRPSADAVVLASVREDTEGYGEDGHEFKFTSCPEVVYFPNLRAIGIQGHPEWMQGSAFNQYCLSLIKQHLIKEQ